MDTTSRKVAIVGAGPSGLVTAKTLLHNYPEGTFKPTVFEKTRSVGGLWSVKPQDGRLNYHGLSSSGKSGETTSPSSSSAGFVSPSMLTNLSRFTVSFSDLAWESVDLRQTEPSSGDGRSQSATTSSPPPLFPKAWQVGRYLETYAERYLPPDILKLGCRVVRTERRSSDKDGGTGWVVEWSESINDNEDTEPNGGNIKREEFDYLVVASGYFSVPHIPDIAKLPGFQDRILHSSALRDVDSLLQKWNHHESPSSSKPAKLVVFGGSFSAAEAATTLALHLSSLAHSPQSPARHQNLTVHHITSRPFWILPTVLPSAPQTNTSSVTFLPMDLIMYDLSRRPPGEINYAFGAVPQERSTMVNSYFESLVGTDQSNLGNGALTLARDSPIRNQPPWIALADSYAEYLRAGQVQATIGRLSNIVQEADGKLVKIEIQPDSGQREVLNDVVAVVFATGFKPFPSLSFLPSDLLSRLEYTEKDSYLTIVLDDKGVSHADIPDLGFVGFYRGAFWGVAEMQARSLAEQWIQHGQKFPGNNDRERQSERHKYYELRKADPRLERAQFPMGDYIGLMETFARDLRIKRVEMTEGEERGGPVVPARYQTLPIDTKIRQLAQRDAQLVVDALRAALSPSCTSESRQYATSKAIFRGLQGSWKFKRTEADNSSQPPGTNESREISGTATFHPRCPTLIAWDSEYIYDETIQREASSPSNTAKSILRFREVVEPGAATHVGVWGLNEHDATLNEETSQIFSHNLHICWKTGQSIVQEDNWEIQAVGSQNPSAHLPGVIVEDGQPEHFSHMYTFVFQGIYIVSWRVSVVALDAARTTTHAPDVPVVAETTYRRV